MAYKHGGDVHKAVKEKSMHHMKHHEAKHRKTGGRAEEEEDGNSGVDTPEPDTDMSYTYQSNVTKEAKDERKKGGAIKKVAKKKGGEVAKKKHVGEVEGEAKKHRLDRPGRKRGGGVGADTSPLTTAANTSERRGPSKADDDRGITGEE